MDIAVTEDYTWAGIVDAEEEMVAVGLGSAGWLPR